MRILLNNQNANRFNSIVLLTVEGWIRNYQVFGHTVRWVLQRLHAQGRKSHPHSSEHISSSESSNKNYRNTSAETLQQMIIH